MPLNAEAETKIKSILDSNVSHGIPGLVFCAIDKSGKFLTKQASGNIGAETNTPIGFDHMMWIASLTKIFTAVACMQLVEQGKLDLDSSDHLYKICPELKSKRVINDDGGFDEKEKEITLRMLLTHTSGFGYNFTHPKLLTYTNATNKGGYFEHELVCQPGTKWQYGVGIDWVGVAIERVSGLSADNYFKKHIFEPLGIENISIFPSENMKKQMIKMHVRDESGFKEVPHIYSNYFEATTEEEKSKVFQSAGSGCFGSPSEFCLLLATILNDGVSPNTGAKLLEKKSVDEMFTNHIPHLPNFGYEGFPSTIPLVSNSRPDMYPQAGSPPQGWGLATFLTMEPCTTGRGPNTGWWAGIANLYYWVDRAKGVAGVIAAQFIPFFDEEVVDAWIACEKAVYDGLGENHSNDTRS